jgi:DNA-directed RNA polymerase subunit RPC12/RpoP
VNQPSAGTAVIFNRPFGPQCLLACPRGKGTCGVECEPTPGDGPRWKNHGSDDQPTLTPSIDCRSCGWHGYVQKGRLKDPIPDLINFQHICPNCQEPTIMGFDPKRIPRGGFDALGVARPAPTHVQATAVCPVCSHRVDVMLEVPRPKVQA